MARRYDFEVENQADMDTKINTEEFEKRIEEKIKELGEDYDLSELNSNDKMAIRALAQAFISLEDYEIKAYTMKKTAKLSGDFDTLKRIEDTISSSRGDIVKLQNSLGITRNLRKNDSTMSALEELERLKALASEFYEERMAYVYCPKCNMLLGTFWTKYPNDSRNKITLVCNRKLEEGICGEKFTVSTAELLENRGTNNKDIMPEGIR